MTSLPFEPNQIVTLLVLFAGVLMAYAELKFSMKAQDRRLAKLEEEVDKLLDGAISAALLNAAIGRIEQEVVKLNKAAVAMDRFMIRASIKLNMESQDV